MQVNKYSVNKFATVAPQFGSSQFDFETFACQTADYRKINCFI